jgi:hypothetical protein
MELAHYAALILLAIFVLWASWTVEGQRAHMRTSSHLLRQDAPLILAVVVHAGERLPDCVPQLFTRALHPQNLHVVVSICGPTPMPRDRVTVVPALGEFAGAGPTRRTLLGALPMPASEFDYVLLLDSNLEPCNAWDRRGVEALRALPAPAVLCGVPHPSGDAAFVRIDRVSSRGLHTRAEVMRTTNRAVAAALAQHRCLLAPPAALECTSGAPSATTADTILTWQLWAQGFRPFHPAFAFVLPTEGKPPHASKTWGQPHGLDTDGARAYARAIGWENGTVSLAAQHGVLNPRDQSEVEVKCTPRAQRRLQQSLHAFPSVVEVKC